MLVRHVDGSTTPLLHDAREVIPQNSNSMLRNLTSLHCRMSSLTILWKNIPADGKQGFCGLILKAKRRNIASHKSCYPSVNSLNCPDNITRER